MINSSVFIRKNDRHLRLLIQDIQYIEAAGSYLLLVTSKEQFSLSQNLSHFMRKNAIPELVRIHRSYVVNIGKVDSFDNTYAYIGDKRLPIGATYKDDFMKSVHCV